MWTVTHGVALADWVAEPGTVKVFARRKLAGAEVGAERLPLPTRLLNDVGARVVDDQDTFLVLQLPLPNASASPGILRDIADVVEVRDDFDILRFLELPVDARELAPDHPVEWRRDVALPSPVRDAFVLQFATVPRPEWLEELKSAGVTVLNYVPQNGYVVLGDQAVLRRIVSRLPIQLFRIHQPFHKVSPRLRAASDSLVDAEILIADVPEASDALAVLAGRTLQQLRMPEGSGDRTIHRVRIDALAVPQLASLPAVLWLDTYTPPQPSGQRETHLTIGDTLVSNAGGVLSPVVGDHRQWITSKGLGNYRTAVRLAILDTGFDIGSSTDVHRDFRSALNASFITVRRYTNTAGSDADCYGHGTFVAGLLAGNAGGTPNATQTKDVGASGGPEDDYYMGLGILPETPLVVGRVFNYLPGPWNPDADCDFCFDPQDRRVIYQDLLNLGVGIVSNSYNNPRDPLYNAESQLLDRLVRNATGANGGTPMVVYFAGGNAENNAQGRVSAPATAKNVISVGGSENFNPSPYAEPTSFNPSATGGVYADNGNQIWAVSQVGPTYSDGRIKPDIVAPASAIESPRTRETSVCRAEIGGTNAGVGVLIDPASPVGERHLWSRGTSFSAPLAAGAGGLLYTWFRNTTGATPRPALLKAMQINLASDLSGAGRPPDSRQGWGKADLTRAFATDNRYIWNNEEANTLVTASGQRVLLPAGTGTGYRIKDTNRPVRVTVVWTDAAGDPESLIALVNDLDLTVYMRAAGRYALGNDFNTMTGRSNVRTTSGTPNSRDNVEQVVFTYADAGTDHFQVEVFGKSIAGDGLNAWSPVTNQQNFALFIDNAEVYQNNASYPSQTGPATTVQAGSPYTASIVMQNTGNTTWTEGPNNFYRLGSISAKSAFDLDGRALLNGQTVAPGQSGTFTLSGTAPYSAGTYPLQCQMLEENVQWFGAPTPLFNVTVTPKPYAFYTVTPCRVLDTRNAVGPYGGPSLNPSAPRTFALRGQCGIPTTATSVSANLTAINPTGIGHLTVYPANVPTTLASTLNYKAGNTRANNAILTVDAIGQIEVVTAFPVDLVLDVNGYFQ